MAKNYLRKKNKVVAAGILVFGFAIFFAGQVFFSKNNQQDFFITPAHASTFTDSITALGSSPATFHLSPGTYNIDSDFSIPQNITLHFDDGAVISIANGATLTLYGNIDDNRQRIFDDQNTDLAKGVKFAIGTSTALRPEWWGARPDNNQASAVGNSNAIEKAMKAGGVVQFSVGKYYLERTIALAPNTSFVGEGNSKDAASAATLILRDNANCNLTVAGFSSSTAGISIINVRFDGGNQSAAFDGLNFTGKHFAGGTIRGNTFVNFKGYAVNFDSGARNFMEENLVQNCFNGMYLNFWDTWFRNNTINFTGDYGINMMGTGHPFEGNVIDGGTSGVNCIFRGSNSIEMTHNTLRNCDYGLRYAALGGGGLLSDNVITNNRHDGIYSASATGINAVVNSPIIEHNQITNNGGYGINFPSGAATGGTIRNNTVTGNAAGAINIAALANCSFMPLLCYDAVLVENNIGMDTDPANFPKLAQNDNTPLVTAAAHWQTNNSSPTSIIEFAGGAETKTITLKINDANTTLKFNANKGPDKVVNGDFSSSTGWTINSDWAYDSVGKMMTKSNGNSSVANGLRTDIGALANEYYEVTFTIKNYVSGSIVPYIGDSYWGTVRGFSVGGNGTFTQVVRANANGSRYLEFEPLSSFVGSIDDVSAKKVDTVLKGYGGVDKHFAVGDVVRCTKASDTYWYCNDGKMTYETHLSADLNLDGSVNQNDLDILKADFLKLTGSLANPKSDIDGDGTVTLKDMGILMSQWKP